MARTVTLAALVAAVLISPGLVAASLAAGGTPTGRAQDPAPAVSLSAGSLDFGEQAVDTKSAPQRITVTNTGNKPLYVNSAEVSGDAPGDFVLDKDTCTGATIPAGKSCVLDVVFAPTAAEPRRATLTLTHSAVDSPQTVDLTGGGINSAAVDPVPDR
jgi:hypothetical protein